MNAGTGLTSCVDLTSLPLLVRDRLGSPSRHGNSPVCPGGNLATLSATRAISTTTTTRVPGQSVSRWPTVSDSVGHGGLAAPAQLSGKPNTRPKNSHVLYPHTSWAVMPRVLIPSGLATAGSAGTVRRERHHLLEGGAVLPGDAGLADEAERPEPDRVVMRHGEPGGHGIRVLRPRGHVGGPSVGLDQSLVGGLEGRVKRRPAVAQAPAAAQFGGHRRAERLGDLPAGCLVERLECVTLPAAVVSAPEVATIVVRLVH